MNSKNLSVRLLREDLAWVALEGILRAELAARLEESLAELRRRGINRVLLDLRQAERMASAVVTAILAGRDAAAAAGGYLLLVNAKPGIRYDFRRENAETEFRLMDLGAFDGARLAWQGGSFTSLVTTEPSARQPADVLS